MPLGAINLQTDPEPFPILVDIGGQASAVRFGDVLAIRQNLKVFYPIVLLATVDVIQQFGLCIVVQLPDQPVLVALLAVNISSHVPVGVNRAEALALSGP